MKYAIELIEWEDHASMGGPRGWGELDEARRLMPTTIYSVGWVITESDRHLVMVAHQGGEQIDGELCIIKACITKRTLLLKDADDAESVLSRSNAGNARA